MAGARWGPTACWRNCWLGPAGAPGRLPGALRRHPCLSVPAAAPPQSTMRFLTNAYMHGVLELIPKDVPVQEVSPRRPHPLPRRGLP